MNVKKQIEYWLKTAEHDLRTAQDLFDKKRFDWCLFLGHLVLEKVLKAHYVHVNKENPPRTHKLVRLAEKISLHFSEEQLTFLATVTEFNVEARYPDEKMDFYETCNEQYTQDIFFRIKEQYAWLLKQM